MLSFQRLQREPLVSRHKSGTVSFDRAAAPAALRHWSHSEIDQWLKQL
jgi:hypothetical protein